MGFALCPLDFGADFTADIYNIGEFWGINNPYPPAPFPVRNLLEGLRKGERYREFYYASMIIQDKE
jgi:hypothetical protein